ncbi:MAG TPA: hypothetical protein VFW80_12240 [Gaiellaceae bacterium]|nr:hypothetical protein [Gaiellaceae bacterium]
MRLRWLGLRDAADERLARLDAVRWRWSSDRLRRSADLLVVSLVAGGLLVLGLFAAAAATDASSAGKLPVTAQAVKQKVVPQTVTEKLPGKRLVRNRKVTATETVRAKPKPSLTTVIAGRPTVIPLDQTVTVTDSRTETVTQSVTQAVTVTEPVTVTQSVTVTVPPGQG